MTNRLKIKEEEIQEEAQPELIEPGIALKPDNFLILFFTRGIITKETATEALPFIVFVAFLGMVYIGNRHSAENNIREIDKLSKEVKEQSWDFKTLKAELMFRSKQTEVVQRVDSVLGLKVPVQPPIKLKIGADEYKN